MRRFTEGKDAVLQQDQAFRFGIFPEDLEGLLGQREPRHDVGDDCHRVAEDEAAELLAMRLIAQRQHGIGVGMIDEFVGQEGVQ